MGCIARVAMLVALVACAAGEAPQPAMPQPFTSPGPLFAGHKALDCTRCHAGATAEVDSNKCMSCHDAVADQVFAGKGLHASVVIRMKRCEICHADHRGPRYDPMGWRSMRGGLAGFDHGLTGWPLGGAHRVTACNKCHSTLDREGLPTFLGVNASCGGCHADPHRFDKSPLEDCGRCHSSHAWQPPLANPRFDHNDRKDTRMPLFGAHKAVPCRGCHASAVFRFGLAKPDRCDACHQSPHAGHLFSKAPCDWCHSPTFKTLRANNFDHSEKTRFDLDGHRSLPCETCHAASAGMTKPPRTCESCHADRNPHGARFAGLGSPSPCGACHKASNTAPSTWKLTGRFDHGKQTKFPLTGKHAEIACRACHRGKGPTSFEVLDLSTGCTGCHEHAKVHANKYTNAQCTSCHIDFR